MKKGSIKFIFTSAGLLFGFWTLQAQTGVEDGSRYGHGEDSIRCVRNLTLYREAIKQRDSDRALPMWKIPFDECPESSKNIFLDGIKLYREILDKATDDLSKKNALDTLMLIYDRRIEYYQDVGNVRGRQGVDLLRYGRTDIKNIEVAFNYLKESIEIEKSKASEAAIGSYFSASIVLFQNNVFPANQVIEDYLMVTTLVDEMIKKDPRKEKGLRDLKASIDENFVNDGPGDCKTLIDFFSVQVEPKKTDPDFLRMLTTLLRNRNCTDSELFYSASKYLHEQAPTAESALNIAIMEFNKQKFESAATYYQQAINLETTEDKKADYYFGMAACNSELKNKVKSRELALKASAIRPSWGEPYILIGQLYADSRNDCSSITLPNAIYWVAVDYFIKAKTVDLSVEEKANKLILVYSGYFPNKEEAFFQNVTEGNSYSVGCWINETTKARFNN
jgi:tetratricopeptide (TPR) repeat protein